MARPTLKASVRTSKGKGPARRLRMQGLVPAVVYGKGAESRKVTIEPKALLAILDSDAGRYQTIDLQVEGESAPRLALIKEYALHPFKRTLKHVDFWQVDPNQSITLKVPLVRKGMAAIEKLGGRITFTKKLIRIKCTPTTLPAAIEYDLTHVTEAIRIRPPRVSEIEMPEGIEALYKSDYAFLQLRLRVAETDEDEEGEEGEEGEEAAPAAE